MTEHEEGVAAGAEIFAGAFEAGPLARIAGLLHDAGKYHDEFQAYLDACVAAKAGGTREPHRGPDHKSAGALLLGEMDLQLAELLSPVIFGHHGGLPSQADLENLAEKREFHASSLVRVREAQPNLGLPAVETIPAVARLQTPLQAELLIRMVFSCLVDADGLDTEVHFDPIKAAQRTEPPSIQELLVQYRDHQARLLSRANQEPPSSVNRVRREVYEACLQAASQPRGIFRLTAPTGSGKTLSSIGFALEHADRHRAEHGKAGVERIIYALPFTSIVDQTADVLRRVFTGEKAVLEHHSAIQEPDDPIGGQRDQDLWRRLASENWDATIIVTTTVQLFDSLFSNRRGRCRKLHRLANSVILLDEVQTLPLQLLKPILDVLTELVEGYGVTVVLCSATQPALDGSSPYLKGLPNVQDIIRDPEPHFRDLERVRYRVCLEGWTWAEVAARMRAEPQCLTVVNTRPDARALWAELRDPDAIHLSTMMCGAHRRRALAEVRARLNANLPCRVVSTQLIEAGVDVDFLTVFRAIGPFDRIIQSAGRCNREGRLLDKGEVIIFFPSEGSAPSGTYKMALEEALAMLERGGVDFHHPDAYTNYFQRILQNLGSDTDRYRIQSFRTVLNFPEVATKFRMIRDEAVPVLVDYDPYIYRRILLAAREPRLRHTHRKMVRQPGKADVKSTPRGRLAEAEWRVVQQHVVGIRQRDFEELCRSTIEVVIPDQLYAWAGEYDPVLGLTGVARDPLDLIA